MSLLWMPLALLASLPHVEATGIIASTEPSRSVAILRCEGVTRIVGVGDTAFGARVEGIEPGRVRLSQDGQAFDARLAGSVAVASAPPPAAPPDAVAQPEPVALEPVELPKREVDRRLALEIPRILAQTKLSPLRRDQEVVGFTLERLPPDSLLTEVGLQPGDVLTEINGVRLDSMATLAGLWPRLRDAVELTAVVLRGGRAVSVGVSLTP